MTARPRYTPAASDDLRRIGDHISQDNPARAVTFVAELCERCRKIAARPRVYRLREEFGPGVRSAVHGAYLILYTPRDDGQVVIERVVHGTQDLGELPATGQRTLLPTVATPPDSGSIGRQGLPPSLRRSAK